MDEAQETFRKLLDRAAELLQTIYSQKAKKIEGKVPEEVLRQLKEVEKGVEAYVSLHKDAIAASGIKEEEIQAILLQKDQNISRENQQLISYAKKIAQDAKQLQRDVNRAIHKPKKQVTSASAEKPTKKKSKARKKKFKRLGGDDQWIPL